MHYIFGKYSISGHTEMRVYQYGIQTCLPLYAFGPAVRDHYLIHFILEGRGVFQSEGRTYDLKAGQTFLILPGQIAFYQADSTQPWHYAWIGFSGNRAGELIREIGLSRENPVINCPPMYTTQRIAAHFEAMAEAMSYKRGRDLRLLGLLYLFLSELYEHGPSFSRTEGQLSLSESYVKQAIQLIQMNYSRKISIQNLAHQIGLDRSYFGVLFRRHTNLAPQQYLLHFRMEKAGDMLLGSSLPVSAVAHSVGYEDPQLFTRMFHQVKGFSPTDYRRQFA